MPEEDVTIMPGEYVGKNEGRAVLQQKQEVRRLHSILVENNDLAVLYELL